MKKRGCVLTLAAVLVSVGATPSFADMFSIQVINDGVAGGVSFSWLTSGTSNSGSNPSGYWRVDGAILVNYNPTGGTLGLGSIHLAGGPQDLVINKNNVPIGRLTVDDFFLEDPDHSGVLGYMDVSVTSFGNNALLDSMVAGSSSGRIDYLDKNYGSASNGFNSFGVVNDVLSIRLWGNETVFNDPAHPASPVNWGTDWSSSGSVAVPAPGAVFLGVMGLSMVGWIKRRLV